MNLIRAAFSTPKRTILVIQQLSTTANYTSKYADSVSSSWRDLLKNPLDWRDYRQRKSIGLIPGKYPDFKHNTNGTALWLGIAPPSWVVAGLEGLNVGNMSNEDSWKNLVENPDEWWDQRLRKSNVRAPDFIHKETREALWLHSSPKWVLAMLEGLNVEMRKNEDSWKNLVNNPDKWWDQRLRKTNVKAPDFIHKETREALWLGSSPKWVLTMLDGLNVEMRKREDSWMNLVENPDKWWDRRLNKINVNAPDFVHKKTSEALWVDSSPKWVLAMLEEFKVGMGKKGASWKNLVENRDEWLDNRQKKTKATAPDFVHKETNEGLWLDNAPTWVLARAEGLNVGKGKKEDRWKNLVENRDEWLDNRPRKTNVNMPDFQHKETNEGLWLSCCPNWLLSQLPC